MDFDKGGRGGRGGKGGGLYNPDGWGCGNKRRMLFLPVEILIRLFMYYVLRIRPHGNPN